MLTVEKIAKGLNIKEATVRLWLRTGKLKGEKVGRHWRINPEDLRELVPEGVLYGFADERLRELAKIVRPEAWKELQENEKTQDRELKREHLLNEIQRKYSEQIPLRFPYPYEDDEIVSRDDNGQPYYGKDEEVYEHYYKTKLKEEKRKLDKLLEYMQKEYGVQNVDVEEIRRTIDNVLILTLSGYDSE